VPVSLLMILFATVILGILGIIPWMPPDTGSPSSPPRPL
jgi:hypothetical protein